MHCGAIVARDAHDANKRWRISMTPWFLQQSAGCDIRLVTRSGPWANSGRTWRMSEGLASCGIAHLDDCAPKGDHNSPYWHHQMWGYVGAHF